MTMRSRSRPVSLLTHNLRVLMRLFRDRGPLSQEEASRITGLESASVGHLTERLAQEGILIRQEGGAHAFNAGKAYAVSLHIDEESLNGVLYDLQCHLVHKLHVSTEWNPAYETTMDALAVMVLRLIGEAKIPPEKLCGIAISCDGVVDVGGGVAKNPLHHAWPKNRPLRDDLLARLPFEADILVDNACRLLACAEVAGEEIREDECIVTIFAEHSTGGSILRGGRPLHGRGGLIGEVGHIVVDPDSDALCTCGQCGCFESLVSPVNVWRIAQDLEGDYPEAPLKAGNEDEAIWELFARNEQGDPLAGAVMDAVASYFAQVITGILLLHDPDSVILQGLYSRAGDAFLSSIRAKIRAHPFLAETEGPAVVYSELSFRRPDVYHFFGLGGAVLLSNRFIGRYQPRLGTKR